MTAQEEIDRLSQLIRTATQEHGNAPLRLEINNMTFRGTTQRLWESNNWSIHEDEANAIMNGNDDQRRAALLKFLQGQGVTEVVFLPGADLMNVVPVDNVVTA